MTWQHGRRKRFGRLSLFGVLDVSQFVVPRVSFIRWVDDTEAEVGVELSSDYSDPAVRVSVTFPWRRPRPAHVEVEWPRSIPGAKNEWRWRRPPEWVHEREMG